MGQHSKPQHQHHPFSAVATWAKGILVPQHQHQQQQPQPVAPVASGAVEWLSGTEWCQRHSRAAATHQAPELGHDAGTVR